MELLRTKMHATCSVYFLAFRKLVEPQWDVAEDIIESLAYFVMLDWLYNVPRS